MLSKTCYRILLNIRQHPKPIKKAIAITGICSLLDIAWKSPWGFIALPFYNVLRNTVIGLNSKMIFSVVLPCNWVTEWGSYVLYFAQYGAAIYKN